MQPRHSGVLCFVNIQGHMIKSIMGTWLNIYLTKYHHECKTSVDHSSKYLLLCVNFITTKSELLQWWTKSIRGIKYITKWFHFFHIHTLVAVVLIWFKQSLNSNKVPLSFTIVFCLSSPADSKCWLSNSSWIWGIVRSHCRLNQENSGVSTIE
jgi:hypothetical protein